MPKLSIVSCSVRQVLPHSLVRMDIVYRRWLFAAWYSPFVSVVVRDLDHHDLRDLCPVKPAVGFGGRWIVVGHENQSIRMG